MYNSKSFFSWPLLKFSPDFIQRPMFSIAIMVPKIVKWGNYFKYFECNNVFQRLDHDIFQKIQAWIYRRHPTWGHDKIKQKYFPKNKSWIFRGKAHQANWILYNFYTTAFKVKKEYYLVKLSWIASHKHIEVGQDKGPIKLEIRFCK
jgi:hypothetical protein